MTDNPIPRPFAAAWLALTTHTDFQKKVFNATGTNIDYSAFFPGFGFTKEQKPLFNAFVASFAGNTDVVKALAMVRTTWQNSKQHLESDGVSYNPIDCPTTQQLQNIGNNSAD